MRHSKRSLEGVLIIDHRASPGTAEVPEGTVMERATLTCAHCHVTVIVNPKRTRPRNWCQHCDLYVCDHPTCVLECRKLREEHQSRNALLDRLQVQGMTRNLTERERS